MSASIAQEFAALIGIDWADRKHDVCELPLPSRKPLFSVIPSSPKSIQDWATQLKKRYPGQRIAVATELKKGPLIYALSGYDHLVLFPVNSRTVAKYRKAFASSGAKDDPGDARILADILDRHRDKLTRIEPDSAAVRALAQLVEYRRKLVHDRVKLTNRITGILKGYFPQVIDWFKEKDTLIFCDFLDRWPSLAEAKQAHKRSLTAFFNQHNAHYPAINQKRIQNIRSAVPLTDDEGVIAPNRIMMTLLIPQLRLLLEAIAHLDTEIDARYKAFDDRKIFDSLPGAGPKLAPRLLVAFGQNRARFSSPADLQQYAGVAPVIEQSGQKQWTHWRYSCPTFLRQTFVEWAGQSVRFSFWAKAYYEQQKARGKPHNTIIRSLAFKWIRIVFRCWIERKPYDESTYLQALKDRNSPLLEYALNG